MVFWEITLGTAYFLGLKRTYRLALKIQRRIISPKHPKIRAFLYRRTRAMFDVALKVHKNIQDRDIEAGRNLGNWILRCLDKMKPSAEIRPKNYSETNNKASSVGPLSDSSKNKSSGSFKKFDPRSRNQDSDRHLFTASRNMFPKSFHPISMMKPIKPAESIFQQRHFSISGQTMNSRKFGNGVIRKDIMQWMHT
ncbi:hypothetical protein Leryth_025119 [Lithospermum erythrorhizon]|nr:hypothetical protein Leryth_025119 [Lithospermum erythrorhizon]